MSPSSAAADRATAANARAAAQIGAPARRPVAPRRVSGPAHPARPAERVGRPTVGRPPSPAPFTQHVTRVVDNTLLDRLIRGRAWIGLIAFALIGIVAMQVTLLKLNAGIGDSIKQVTALQRESSLLAAQVAGLGSASRVQAEAARLGMVSAPPGDVRYLRAGPGDARRAATSFVAPSPAAGGSAGVVSAATATSSSGGLSTSSASGSSASSTGANSTGTLTSPSAGSSTNPSTNTSTSTPSTATSPSPSSSPATDTAPSPATDTSLSPAPSTSPAPATQTSGGGTSALGSPNGP